MQLSQIRRKSPAVFCKIDLFGFARGGSHGGCCRRAQVDRLRQEAERRGVSPDVVTVELLDEHLPHDEQERRSAAVTMLCQWADENLTLSDEVAAENAAVLRALDAHRASYRKLFENVLKDENGGFGGSFYLIRGRWASLRPRRARLALKPCFLISSMSAAPYR